MVDGGWGDSSNEGAGVNQSPSVGKRRELDGETRLNKYLHWNWNMI